MCSPAVGVIRKARAEVVWNSVNFRKSWFFVDCLKSGHIPDGFENELTCKTWCDDDNDDDGEFNCWSA